MRVEGRREESGGWTALCAVSYCIWPAFLPGGLPNLADLRQTRRTLLMPNLFICPLWLKTFQPFTIKKQKNLRIFLIFTRLSLYNIQSGKDKISLLLSISLQVQSDTSQQWSECKQRKTIALKRFRRNTVTSQEVHYTSNSKKTTTTVSK